MLQIFVACYFFMKGASIIHCERYLGGYLRAISNAMAQDVRQSAEQNGLTSTQSMFLHHLWYRQVRTQQVTYAKDLEEFFDIKHSTVSGVLQRMEAAGFVTVHSSKTDRRCKAITLTEKGLSVIEQTGQHIQQTEARLVQNMTEEEVAEFRRLLQMAAHNLGVCMPHITKHEKEGATP